MVTVNLLGEIYCYVFIFFFKQKTAYEMRISDWSSDVCSSDLRRARHGAGDVRERRPAAAVPQRCGGQPRLCQRALRGRVQRTARRQADARLGRRPRAGIERDRQARSEEHTSELKSLMRTSYAVFCLKKNNNINRKHYTTETRNQNKS